jgi:hypothetical protein
MSLAPCAAGSRPAAEKPMMTPKATNAMRFIFVPS